MSRVTLDMAKARIAELYPGVDLANIADPRALHARKITSIVEELFDTVVVFDEPVAGKSKALNIRIDFPEYVDLVVAKVEYWDALCIQHHKLTERKLASLLPLHEEVYAIKILSPSNEHHEGIVAIVEDTDAGYLVQPVTKSEPGTSAGDAMAHGKSFGDSPSDIIMQAKRLADSLEKKLEGVQKEREESEKKEKTLQEAIKSIGHVVANVRENLISASML